MNASAASGGFAGRVAFVTGGGSGIGAAVARQLAFAGAVVVAADLDPEALAHVVDEIRSAGGAAEGVVVDVGDVGAVDGAVDAVVARHGRLDVAFNNAGITGPYGPLHELEPDAWEQTLRVNLTGVFHCLRAELRHMVPAGAGAIVNTSSGAGQMGVPHLAAYSATKHGIIGLTRSAALEVVKSGVRVNAVCPGAVRTPMLRGFVGGSDEALDAMGRGASPMGRLGAPEEIAEAVTWLLSDAASFVTGHALAVDGGALAT